MKNIGIDVQSPDKTCEDKKCPYHGDLKVSGNIIEGVVTSDLMTNTVVVERQYTRYMPKYERYEKRKSKIHVHSPPCFEIKKGDYVKFMQCRPISKTVSHVIIERKVK